MGQNRVVAEFSALAENVGLARLLTAMVAVQAGFTLAEVDEVKLAVSEAVTNAVVHGYGPSPEQTIRLEIGLESGELRICVADAGRGIADLQHAMQPAVSSDPERMGLGFCFMQSHMDSLEVESSPGRGTRVVMRKRPGSAHLVRSHAE